MMHRITFSEKDETVEYSHGREVTFTNVTAKCGCGEVSHSVRASNVDVLYDWIREHKINVLLLKAGIDFTVIR